MSLLRAMPGGSPKATQSTLKAFRTIIRVGRSHSLSVGPSLVWRDSSQPLWVETEMVMHVPQLYERKVMGIE